VLSPYLLFDVANTILQLYYTVLHQLNQMMRFGRLLCLVLLMSAPTLLLADKGGLRAVRRLEGRPIRPANGTPFSEWPTRPRPERPTFGGGGSATDPIVTFLNVQILPALLIARTC